MNETKVQASLNRIVAGINTEFDAMDDTDRGTLLANAIGQRGAACGASAAPTGCASNGDTEDE